MDLTPERQAEMIDYVIDYMKRNSGMGDEGYIASPPNQDAKRVYGVMKAHGIISPDTSVQRLSGGMNKLDKLGYEVSEAGGWINYLKQLEEKKAKEESKEALELQVKNLQRDNLTLNNEALTYKQTIRKQEGELMALQTEKIEHEKKIWWLEDQLKLWTLFKNWWGLLVGCVVTGGTIGVFLTKLLQLYPIRFPL